MSCPMLLHRSDPRPSPRSTSHLGNFSYPLPWVLLPKQARRHTITGPPDPPCLICGVFARPTLRPPPKMVLPLDVSSACMTCREKKYVVKNTEQEKTRHALVSNARHVGTITTAQRACPILKRFTL
ncbi:hypothetical protein BC629DRAFT_981371 [Irpex lacteus]|nr:hypothetical protein BC629DRAFT_981371 [Irpex lacteus]